MPRKLSKTSRKPKKMLPIKPRKKYELLNNQLLTQASIDQFSKTLLRQVDDKIFREKYAKVEPVLKLIGAGLFLAGAIVAPSLPKALIPASAFSPYRTTTLGSIAAREEESSSESTFMIATLGSVISSENLDNVLVFAKTMSRSSTFKL